MLQNRQKQILKEKKLLQKRKFLKIKMVLKQLRKHSLAKVIFFINLKDGKKYTTK